MQTSVLVVDDDDDVLFMADRYLSSRGFRVVTSNTPREVPRLLRRESPDVLVLDLMMPDIDGAELARFARRSIPLVFYSAADEGHLAHVALMHPHAHVVAKGGPLSLLAETIRTAIALSVNVPMNGASEPVPRE